MLYLAYPGEAEQVQIFKVSFRRGVHSDVHVLFFPPCRWDVCPELLADLEAFEARNEAVNVILDNGRDTVACALCKIRIFAFICFHRREVGGSTVTCAVCDVGPMASNHVAGEGGTVTCALREIRISAFIRFDVGESTVTCAARDVRHVGVEGSTVTCALCGIRIFAFNHDPLHDDY